ncbi:MAG: TlpA disulfide reductase family protein [Planctomycetota bacterium]
MLCQLAAIVALAAAGALAAQDPPPAPAERPAEPPVQRPVAQQVQALIDRFHKVMPRDPATLRQASIRRTVAPAALPVLRAIHDFVREHADCDLAARGLEFTIYAAVLDDETVREPLQQQATTKDLNAKLMLDCAAAIQATDDERRAVAIDAVGAGLSRKPTTTDDTFATSAAAKSVVMCLVMAGDLSEAEANLLAKRATDKNLVAQLEAAAQRAANDPRQLLGKPLELMGKLVGGEPFTTASLRGKVVLVDFWATWCQPCVRSLPDLVKTHAKYKAQGLAVVGVSSDRDVGALTAFLAARPEIDWPQLFEPGQQGWHPLAGKLGVTAIPRLFVIDKKGVLRSIDAHDKLDKLLVRLLAE